MEGRLREVLEGLLERGVRGAALLRPDGLLLEAVGEAYELLEACRETELVAQALRGAALAIGSITGEITADDILDSIFSRFCIGK